MGKTMPIPRERIGTISYLPFRDDDPNLPTMLRRQTAQYGPRTLFLLPTDSGIQEVSWERYLADVVHMARGLVELGIRPGETIALSSENRYEWRVADLAILFAGCVSVPLHAALTGPQARHEVVDSESKVLIISGDQQADKFAPVADRLEGVEHIIAFDSVRWAGRQPVIPNPDLIRRPAKAPSKVVDEQTRREKARTRHDLATIIYTSGTTGVPKGAMLTHDSILFICDRVRATIGMHEDEVLLSWLPLSHSFGRMADHFTCLMAGCRVALAESHEVLIKRIAQVQPTIMTAVPRIFEKLFALTSMLPPDEQGKKLKSLFGERLRYLMSGGAPLPGVIAEAFLNAGILILEGFGLTETAAISTFNHPHRYRTGTVGTPAPEVDVKLADDGEILIRGRHLMTGYWKMPEATAEVMEGDWFHTGDIGKIDPDGFVVLTDRKKDLIVNSAGKNIAPQLIESTLAQVPLISQVIVIGDHRQFLSALIVPEWLAVDKLFSQMGLEKKPPAEAVHDPTLIEVFQAYIGEALKDLAPWEQVRKFILLPEPFTIEDGLLTPTLKIRRRQALERYKSEIDALYVE